MASRPEFGAHNRLVQSSSTAPRARSFSGRSSTIRMEALGSLIQDGSEIGALYTIHSPLPVLRERVG